MVGDQERNMCMCFKRETKYYHISKNIPYIRPLNYLLIYYLSIYLFFRQALIYLRVVLNSWSPCLQLPNSGMTGVCH